MRHVPSGEVDSAEAGRATSAVVMARPARATAIFKARTIIALPLDILAIIMPIYSSRGGMQPPINFALRDGAGTSPCAGPSRFLRVDGLASAKGEAYGLDLSSHCKCG